MEEEIRKQYEIETGKKWFTVPFTHGEQAFASWGYQLWLEKKISQVEPEVIKKILYIFVRKSTMITNFIKIIIRVWKWIQNFIKS